MHAEKGPMKIISGPGTGYRFPHRREALYGIVLLLVTLLAYHPAWRGKPIWDDDAHIIRPELTSLAGLERIWLQPGATQEYLPVLFSFFWLEGHAWGDTPQGYHFFNLLLHAVAAFLLVMILRRLSIRGAWLAAMIFALHPLQVESVAWITEQKNCLSTVFFFCSLLSYLRFDARREGKSYAIALVLFVTGLMAKAAIVPLPVVLLTIFWWKRGRLSWKKDVLPVIPFFAAGIASAAVNVWVERTFIGAHGPEFTFSIPERILIAGRVFWFYPGKFFWPSPLIFIYPRWHIDASAWWQYLYPSGALLVTGILWQVRKRSRAPFALLMYYGAMIFPVAGFVSLWAFQYSFVADHWQHLASIGPMVLVAGTVSRAFEKKSGLTKVAIYGCFGAALALLTWRQACIYADIGTFYRAIIAGNPSCWMAWNNLGNLSLKAGRTDDAVADYRKALELKSDYANAHYNIGTALLSKGRAGEAMAHFHEALELHPADLEMLNTLCDIFMRNGEPAYAIAAASEAMTRAKLTRRIVLARQIGDNIGAMQQAANSWEAWQSHGIDYLNTGKFDNAVGCLRRALDIDPRAVSSLAGLGRAYAETGRTGDALACLRRALAQDPADLGLLNNLSDAFMRCGDPHDAILAAEKALELAKSAGQGDVARDIGENIAEMRRGREGKR